MSNITYNNKTIAVDPANPTAEEKWTAANANEVKTAVNSKVDQESGKGLSTNDYTTTEKNKLANQSGINTGDQDLTGLQPKENGKGLSTNDYTNAERTKLNGIETGATNNQVGTNDEVRNASITVTDGDSLTAGILGVTPWPNALSLNTGLNIYNKAVAGQTSSEAKTRFDASPTTYGFNRIIWLGRNDFSINAATASATIKANIAAMISAIGHDRYLVFGVTNKSDEPTGNATLNAILAHNSDLANLYGSKFFDVRSFLLTQGNNSTQDNNDIAAGLIPTSLRADGTHFNNLANNKIATQVAPLITNMIGTLGNKLVSISALARTDGTKPVLDASEYFSIGGIPVLKYPNQEVFSGSLILGNTGTKLSNASGTTPGTENVLIIGGQEVTIGYKNTAIGKNSLGSLTSGNSNTGLGSGALAALITSQRNTGVGVNALASSTVGNQNTSVGFQAGFSSLGDDNAFFGNQAGTAATSRNTIIGARAGFAMAAGSSNNTLLGYQAGDNITFGSKNIVIGHDIDVITAGGSNQLNIANLIFGINATGTGTTIAGQIGIGKNAVATAMLSLPAGTATVAPINIPDGVAPTSPVNGDTWFIGDVMYRRINGVTKSLTFA